MTLREPTDRPAGHEATGTVGEAGSIWVGAARRRKGVVSLEGVVRPWHPRYRSSRILLIDGGVPLRWLAWDGPLPEVSRLETEFPSTDLVPPERIALPSTTVVICTRDRADSLRRCLSSVVAGIDADADVLIIDNSPSNPATAEVVVEFSHCGVPIRMAPRARPGLSGARNLALRVAEGDVVAFIDDDVLVEEGWLTPIRRAFASHPSTGMVLGLVPPAELETAAQLAFERRLPWSTRFEPAEHSMRSRRKDSPFPYNAGQLGAGANMSVRRRMALDLGGFEEALGAGTWTRGGEDLEMFVRLLRSGADIYYEPASVVWHVHQRSTRSVRRQLVTYGTGATAYWTSIMTRPGRRDVLRACVPLVRTTLLNRRAIVHTQDEMQLEFLELLGLLAGPAVYAAERVRQRIVGGHDAGVGANPVRPTRRRRRRVRWASVPPAPLAGALEQSPDVVALCIGVRGRHRPPAAEEWTASRELLLGTNMAGVILGLPREVRRHIPSELHGTLRARAFDLSLRRDQVVSSIGPVLEVLEAEGVDFLVFKGPASARLHDRPAARMYGDIDLLVRPTDFARTRRILEATGLELAPESRQPWDAFDTMCREGVNLESGPARVDLHHRIPPWCFSEDLTFDRIYERSESMRFAGTTIRVPSAGHAAVIAALAVLNDLYKGEPALMTWRDLSSLLAASSPEDIIDTFERSGLAWLGDVVVRTLDPTATSVRDRPVVRPPVSAQVRLALLGWHGSHAFARHPLGWVARLSAGRAVLFAVGSLLPSPSYARVKHEGYRSYWTKVVGSFSVTEGAPDEDAATAAPPDLREVGL